MHPFVYSALPTRVVFGSGTIDRLEDELERLNIRRAMVLSTPRQTGLAEAAARRMGSRVVGLFDGATMHTPTRVSERALAQVLGLSADGLVAVGGGSTIGLAKALAYRTDLPQIVVPTTYAGSEMTPILGETNEGRKTTLRNAKVLPETVVYDVDLTLSLPVGISGVSGMNAMAHAVEALYAQDRNPIVSSLAEEAIGRMAAALERVSDDPGDVEGRSDALYAACLCGICLGSVGMALHHKLCHTLGGACDLPHAETHAVLLPHSLAFNAPAAPDMVMRIGRALGTDDPAMRLHELLGRIGAPHGLRALGMGEDEIDRVADLALENPYWNPRPLEREPVRRLLQRAWRGDPPSG